MKIGNVDICDECGAAYTPHTPECSNAQAIKPPPTSNDANGDYNYRFTERSEPIGCICCGAERPLRFVGRVMICKRCDASLASLSDSDWSQDP